MAAISLIMVVASTVVLYLGYREMSLGEVTWKGFLHGLLAKGAVECPEVVNKKWVRIHLTPDSADYGLRVGSQSRSLCSALVASILSKET